MAKYTWRKYQCSECNHIWEETCKSTKQISDCPNCNKDNEYISSVTPIETGVFSQAPSVGPRNASKAADYTARMLESDYGIPPSMINDQTRPGDMGVKSIPESQQARYVQESKINVKNFLEMGRRAGGMGDKNLNGLDVVKAGSESGSIPDPRRHMVQLTAKD